MTQAEILELFDLYHNMVYRLAFAVTRSKQDAEDITQTVFLKLLDGRSGPQPGKERAWLTKVTLNASRDLLRSGWRKRTTPLEEHCDIPFAAPEESVLLDAIMALPEKYRVVVHLHYYEGYTCAEIAVLLSFSASAVSMRLHRARMILRSSLEEEVYEKFISESL